MRIRTIGLLAAGLLGATSANALSFGETITLNYNCTTTLGGNPQCGGGPAGGLTAVAEFTFFNGNLTDGALNDFYLQIRFANTSTYSSNLTSIAFNFPELLASINQFTGESTYGFDGYQVDPGSLNFPGGLRLDACAETAQGGQCGGGLSAGGLLAPQNPPPYATVFFGFDLFTGKTSADFLAAFQPFDSCVRFQSVGPTQNNSGLACSSSDDPDNPPVVPEPGTLALLGLGLLGLGVSRRRVAK